MKKKKLDSKKVKTKVSPDFLRSMAISLALDKVKPTVFPFKENDADDLLRRYPDMGEYQMLENLIIGWSLDGTKTAGTLTRAILRAFTVKKKVKSGNKKENLTWVSSEGKTYRIKTT